ncbi:relaxase/mobilization nuclease domain-containing protein [Jiella mangrovi]|uniref:Relaxase/mobilization nuclease domain-containing protein n=1 Tax=Jiella mangrovi TaxID=2821407 RepID=A0ABS4BQ29_9HYPH|nr:relaxase/mobilization nuclease domain-containing protein [Jiella mangrovi]MBP0618304.1 relaxase/mobilization nuclease domain-containing protein [Jiella mangrovi]
MNPVKIGVGKSFKGLAAYLLHDTRDAGDGWRYVEHRQSAERVGWTQSYNLDDADPEKAWRLMAATAKSADALKAAAGIKKGKTPVNTAYHFSINFSPDDKTDERLEREAVAGALKALKLDGHQALAVRHTDTEHAHIHVMVNLIDPETGLSAASKQNGKAAILSNDTRRLSQWAQKFEREHGLKVVEGRQANANKRQQGEKVDAKRKPRNVYDREKRETKDRRADFIKVQMNDAAAKIAERGRDLKSQHHDEMTAHREAYRQRQGAIRDEEDEAIRAAIDKVKADRKKSWSAMFMRQRSERADFERGEKTMIGRIWHAAAVVKERAQHEDLLGGFVAAFSKENRLAIIERRHLREKNALYKDVRKDIQQAIRVARLDLANDKYTARREYLDERASLKARQAQQLDQVRDLWREANKTRQAELDPQARRNERSRQRDQGRGMTWEQWELWRGEDRGRGMKPD